jgi:hypothetical protein
MAFGNWLMLTAAASTTLTAASMIKPARDGDSAIVVQWNASIITSKTTNTLQVVANPMLLRNSSIHDNSFESLELVQADYLRYVPWFVYPKLAVPEIDAPVQDNNGCSTSWDFTYADQFMEDLYASSPNVSHIINFSTTPGWMWNLPAGTTYSYPADINDADYGYNQGTELRDPTFKEIGDYYSRLVSWYTQGGFTDECGVYRQSGHNYTIELWEVLNEIEAEHNISPDYYNQIYDAIVTAIHTVSPNTQFVGLALAHDTSVEYVQSFLNSSNHAASIPLDVISYHWYGSPAVNTTEVEAAQCFQQVDDLIEAIMQIESVRQQLSPSTKTTLDEIGTMDPQGTTSIVPGYEVPSEYYVWSGAVYAYVFSRVATLGIDYIGQSQLVGFPGQYPSVSLVNYTTGTPNARLRVLELLQQSFAVGDNIVQTNSSDECAFHAQAFISGSNGLKKILLVNKTPNEINVDLPAGFSSGSANIVDLSTGGDPWRQEVVDAGSVFSLTGWATAVLIENPKNQTTRWRHNEYGLGL